MMEDKKREASAIEMIRLNCKIWFLTWTHAIIVGRQLALKYYIYCFVDFCHWFLKLSCSISWSECEWKEKKIMHENQTKPTRDLHKKCRGAKNAITQTSG